MANHPSALKRHRQSLKLRERNRSTNAAVKTFIKKTHAADKEGLMVAFHAAERAIDKAKSKGVLHAKTAARKISRLAKWANSKLAATAA